jgi:hypothetical protein
LVKWKDKLKINCYTAIIEATKSTVALVVCFGGKVRVAPVGVAQFSKIQK